MTSAFTNSDNGWTVKMITVYKKPTRHPYKRVRVVVSGSDNQWDADLTDMSSLSKYYKGIPFSLVVINIFF